MHRPLITVSAAILAAAAWSTGAAADMVAGWDVTPKPDAEGICSMQYDYSDPKDDGAESVVNFTFGKTNTGEPIIVIVFGYSKWELTKGDRLTADLIVGDTVESREAKWEVAGERIIRGTFISSEPLMAAVSRASEMALRFDGDSDDEAWFEIPNAGQAVGAAQLCRGQIK